MLYSTVFIAHMNYRFISLSKIKLIGCLVCLFLFLPHQVSAHSEVSVIEMTSNGFEPVEITIHQGSTVIFVNHDTQPRWPASNTHPTHELYPEFDPRKSLTPNDSWSFKAQRTGEWRYHDHINPHLVGKIIVVAEPGITSSSPTQPSIKDRLSSLFSIIKAWFKKASPPPIVSMENFTTLNPEQQIETYKQFVKASGAIKGWEFIKQKYTNQAGSSGNIHDLAHLAGSLLFETGGFPNLKLCSADFAFGCYHGFLDTAFKNDLSHLDDAYNGCLALGSATSGPAASCIHGIGHGVASFYLTNDLQKSLSTCRKLPDGKQYCFDGVFMEYVRNGSDSQFKKDDPLYPCNDLEANFGPVYSHACGRNLPPLLMGRFNLQFNEVGRVCSSTDSLDVKAGCIDALGFIAARETAPNQIFSLCSQLTENRLISQCVQDAAGELIFQNVPDGKTKAEQLCAMSSTEPDCVNYIQRLTQEYQR